MRLLRGTLMLVDLAPPTPQGQRPAGADLRACWPGPEGRDRAPSTDGSQTPW